MVLWGDPIVDRHQHGALIALDVERDVRRAPMQRGREIDAETGLQLERHVSGTATTAPAAAM